MHFLIHVFLFDWPTLGWCGLVEGARSRIFAVTVNKIQVWKKLDFLKVARLVFWSGVVGPGTNDFYPLQRAKFTGGIFLL